MILQNTTQQDLLETGFKSAIENFSQNNLGNQKRKKLDKMSLVEKTNSRSSNNTYLYNFDAFNKALKQFKIKNFQIKNLI